MQSRKKPEHQVKIAKERTDILFKEAAKQAKKSNLKRANRYIFLLRKIAMKFNIKISKQNKRKFCHQCYHYLLPGKNLVVRNNPKTKTTDYLCLDCNKITRYPYSKK